MQREFDEISLKYWDTNKKKTGSSKSYTCYHKGYAYGDNMPTQNIDMEFVYRKEGDEEHYIGKKDDLKDAYFGFVQSACRKSELTLQNFLTNRAKKYRVYTEEQVQAFTDSNKETYRIKDQSCLITVSGVNYYVASNLKRCEYFNSAAKNIDPADKDNWYIRIYLDDYESQQMEDRDENEEIDSYTQTYTITTVSTPTTSGSSGQRRSRGTKSTVKINHEALNQLKKKIGDLGEAVVLDYEYKRLVSQGRQDLAEKIEHTSKIKGDNAGYDIQSFSEDGTPLFIEVKATRQNKIADFYLSENERSVGNQKLSEGLKYRIYRIYNLNPVTGTGNLAIYEPPFDEEHYSMKAENYRVGLKE